MLRALALAAVLLGLALAQGDTIHRVVMVMRHCVRSTETTFIGE